MAASGGLWARTRRGSASACWRMAVPPQVTWFAWTILILEGIGQEGRGMGRSEACLRPVARATTSATQPAGLAAALVAVLRFRGGPDGSRSSRWFDVRGLNGGYFFTATGFINCRREEGDRLELFLAIIARRQPGSFGLIYERDDEMPDPPGPKTFRVCVITAGKLTDRKTPSSPPSTQ
jgi:hypothetical protein